MTRTAATPGPWKVQIIDRAKSNIFSPDGSVALVYGNLGSPTLNDRDGVGDANARLIAAAPAMREMLERFVGHLAGLNSPPDSEARALLARIEGK